MILEAIVSTLNEDGSVNIAPMGPDVSSDCAQFDLKPFKTSTTYSNLRREDCGVLHVCDDVLLFARAAVGRLDVSSVETKPAKLINGQVIVDSCRWYEFTVNFVDESSQRAVFKCQTVNSGREREFWGFNRGKHAVLEAAILATRVEFLPAKEINQQYIRLDSIVQKTGGTSELEAFEILRAFVESSLTV